MIIYFDNFRVVKHHLLLIHHICADNVILLPLQLIPQTVHKQVILKRVKWKVERYCWVIELTLIELQEDFLPVDSIFVYYITIKYIFFYNDYY